MFPHGKRKQGRRTGQGGHCVTCGIYPQQFLSGPAYRRFYEADPPFPPLPDPCVRAAGGDVSVPVSSYVSDQSVAGASENHVEQVRSAAADIGLAFQIQDDILDVTSTTEVLGKPVFSDEKNNKTTYVTFEGLEASAKDVEGLSKHAIETVNGFHGEKEFLVELIQYLIHREK